jgi:hypothetical protein
MKFQSSSSRTRHFDKVDLEGQTGAGKEFSKAHRDTTVVRLCRRRRADRPSERARPSQGGVGLLQRERLVQGSLEVG